MTEDLMKESMNALKEFAKHKNSYENMTDNLKYENIIFFGKLYSETLDKKLIKNNVEFYICCLNKKATLNFRNESFQDIIISRKSGQKIQKIANLQYYKSKANYGTKKKGISR